MNASKHYDWNSHWNHLEPWLQKHPAQKYRRQEILRLLNKESDLCSILDVGCGQGEMLEAISLAFPKARILGIDSSDSGLSRSRQRVPHGEFMRLNLEKEGPTTHFTRASIAICSEVLEHLTHPVSFLKRVKTMLKPRGKIFVSVPRGPRSSFDISIGHERHYTSQLLAQTFEESGFQPLLIQKSGFPFFNLYRLLVMLQGKNLKKEVFKPEIPLPARVTMDIFSYLFRWNFRQSPFGWQLFGVAESI